MKARYLLSVALMAMIVLSLGGCAWLFPPRLVAVLSANPTTGEAPLSVTFDLSGSSGAITSYSLSFGDNTDPATGTDVDTSIVHTYASPGTYTAQLTVKDARGRTDKATRTITVSEPEGPTATLGVDPSEAMAGESVTFYIEGAPPSGKKIVHWSIDYGDGTVQDNPVNLSTLSTTRTHQYDDPGTYEAVLTVEDEDNATATDSVLVTIASAPPEISDFTVDNAASGDGTAGDPYEVVKETLVEVSFEATAGAGRKIVKWQITFGDGFTVSEEGLDVSDLSVGYTYATGYAETGSYTATARVWDDQDATDSSSVEIEVVDP